MHDPDGSGDEHGPDHHDGALERLARLAATGDTAALRTFLSEIHPPVVRFCRGKLAGSTGILTADDVVQDVMLAVCDALPRFRPEGAIMAFVIGIARFKIVDAFRASGRDQSTPSESMPERPDTDPGPELAAVLATEVVRLKAALALLPDHHREVIVLRVALRYTADEVAGMLDTTAGAVRVTQHRALARLRTLLSDPVPDA
ncbi:sigma-70 family RNA polymerase sigma factor [Pseudonocardia sp.]|uniref:sigma-70 family RNA polymerase sigma factor n=1 Tax=Pseudonocardia sp. TaxID=60912 RepID=UPI00261623AF|nr:sigma-70 family RNA polymerase sigma factor [Pseudonocardia sp.]